MSPYTTFLIRNYMVVNVITNRGVLLHSTHEWESLKTVVGNDWSKTELEDVYCE
jgi:hypothetical protein